MQENEYPAGFTGNVLKVPKLDFDDKTGQYIAQVVDERIDTGINPETGKSNDPRLLDLLTQKHEQALYDQSGLVTEQARELQKNPFLTDQDKSILQTAITHAAESMANFEDVVERYAAIAKAKELIKSNKLNPEQIAALEEHIEQAQITPDGQRRLIKQVGIISQLVEQQANSATSSELKDDTTKPSILEDVPPAETEKSESDILVEMFLSETPPFGTDWPQIPRLSVKEDQIKVQYCKRPEKNSVSLMTTSARGEIDFDPDSNLRKFFDNLDEIKTALKPRLREIASRINQENREEAPAYRESQVEQAISIEIANLLWTLDKALRSTDLSLDLLSTSDPSPIALALDVLHDRKAGLRKQKATKLGVAHSSYISERYLTKVTPEQYQAAITLIGNLGEKGKILFGDQFPSYDQLFLPSQNRELIEAIEDMIDDDGQVSVATADKLIVAIKDTRTYANIKTGIEKLKEKLGLQQKIKEAEKEKKIIEIAKADLEIEANAIITKEKVEGAPFESVVRKLMKIELKRGFLGGNKANHERAQQLITEITSAEKKIRQLGAEIESDLETVNKRYSGFHDPLTAQSSGLSNLLKQDPGIQFNIIGNYQATLSMTEIIGSWPDIPTTLSEIGQFSDTIDRIIADRAINHAQSLNRAISDQIDRYIKSSQTQDQFGGKSKEEIRRLFLDSIFRS